MPNEIKNPLSATTSLNSVVTPELDKNGSDIKKSRLAGSSLTVTVWTMAGVVLAACVGGSTRYLEVEGDGIGGGGTDIPGGGDDGDGTDIPGDGSDGGGTDTPTGNSDYPVYVADGPVANAKIYIDGVLVGTTGEDGRADIDSKYEGQQFTVNVEDATDTYTGETLSGTFTSLANGEGGIATPLTTLVAEKAAADETSNEVALDALINDIFGATTDGEYDNILSVDDITNFDHYTRQYDEVDRFNNSQGDSEAYKSDVITTLSLAITKYGNNDEVDANGNNSFGATLLDALKTIGTRIKDNTIDDNDDTNDTSFIDAIQGLIENAEPVASGAPVASPKTGIEIDEDTEFNVGDYVGNNNELITELFGFFDPGGNKDNETASGFKGIVINTASLTNYTLTLGGVALTTQTALNETAPTLGANEVYINFGRLKDLTITPRDNYPDAEASGTLEFKYKVYDGIDLSAEATLNITVNQVNDLPEITEVSGDRDNSQKSQYVLGIGNVITNADGSPQGFITATDIEDDYKDDDDKEVTYRIEGKHAELFEIDTSGTEPQVQFTGTDEQRLPEGEKYNITIVAIDSDGELSETVTITITINGVNDAPTAVATVPDAAKAATQDAAYSLDLNTLFSDVDGDSLTYTVTTGPSWLSISGADLTGTPAAADVGAHDVTIQANDGDATVDLTFTITVAAPAPASFFTVPNATFANATPDDANDLDATGATERQLIQGGNGNDTITASDQGDVIIGGLGADTINLGDGADVVVHRFLSIAGDQYTNYDGGDVINNFVIGEDKLLLVDQGATPLADWAAFIAADETSNGVKFEVIKNAADAITGINIFFGVSGTVDGRDGSNPTGNTLTINFAGTVANSATDITGNTVNEASELAFVTDTLFGGEDYISVISDDDLLSDYSITIL